MRKKADFVLTCLAITAALLFLGTTPASAAMISFSDFSQASTDFQIVVAVILLAFAIVIVDRWVMKCNR